MNKIRRVIYVDDDVDDRLLFETALGLSALSLKLTVLSEANALHGELQNANPDSDIIFLDLNMPVKNGIELLQEIQDIIIGQKFKVVIFTTSNNQKSIEHTYSLNAALYVQKPADFDDLVFTLTDVISNAGRLTIPQTFDNYKYKRSYA